jgi:hypothetical protein
MIEWFASHSGIEQLFLLAGFVGGFILLFRLILMIAGLDHHGDIHVDSDVGFQALTIQGISSFLAMFGVVGYTLFHGAVVGAALAIVGAIAAGVASMWVIHKIFRGMLRLQSSGTVSLFAAVGSEGTVYLTEPPARIRSGIGRWRDHPHGHRDSRAERDRQHAGGRSAHLIGSESSSG